MSFSYKNLWNTLEHYNMNKTDLRQKLGLSTATLAKLSADQPVSLDILDKICDELGCSLNDVVTHQTNTATSVPWSTISPDHTYLINFYFIHTPEKTAYVYGFATPYHLTEEGLNRWQLAPAKTDPSFYIIRGYITGANLLNLIQAAQNNETIGQLLDRAKVSLTLSNCTQTEQDAICSLFVCNGNPVHRPKYLLPTQTETAFLISQHQPHHSFEDYSMYCESLFGPDKQALYSTDGTPDDSRLQALWQLFKEELPVQNNYNELSRINNFELFSPLLPNADVEKAICWEVEFREEDCKKIPEHLTIHFDHQYLSGFYLVNVSAYNTENAFLDRTVRIYCGEEDVTLRIPLQETLSHATIKVWQSNDYNPDSNLIYSSTHSLMRHIHMDMRMIHRTFQIEDAWTKRMEKKNLKPETKGTYASHHPMSINDNSEEHWVTEEELVQKDVNLLLGPYHPRAEKGLFLHEGSEKHLQFLSWLKKRLSGTDIHRVILIDPYITAESISQLLLSISNSGMAYEIVTDSNTASSKDATRIPNLKRMEHFLDLIQPGKLKIHAVNAPKEFLHDRFLILLDQNQIPIVYILTNSFDNVAEHHASVVMPTDNALARKIFDYYLDRFEEFKKNDQFELLYDSEQRKETHPQTTLATETHEKESFSQEEFLLKLSSDFPTALTYLAYMKPKEKQDCIRAVIELDPESTVPQLLSVLNEYLIHPDNMKSAQGDSILLSTAQLLMRQPDSQGNLLQTASLLSEHCYEYDRSLCGWDVYFAVELLWRISPSRYCEQLDKLKQKLEADRSFSDHRIFKLAASMVGHLATALAFGVSDSERSKLFQSDIPLLRAMATAAVLSLPHNETIHDARIESQLQILQKNLSPKELLFAHLYQIKELQVLICRRPQEYEQIQPLINVVIDHLVAGILSLSPASSENIEFSADDLYQYLLLLYSRNSEDICRIIMKLLEKGYYSEETAIHQLISLFLEKYRKGFANTNEYFRENDLQESCMILRYMEQIDVKSIGKLKKEMSKLERQLQSRLCHAFLKTKNYTLWKSSIDLFCCLVFVELWIGQNYQLPPSPAVKEFRRISENFKATLEGYSEVYQVLMRYFPEMG